MRPYGERPKRRPGGDCNPAYKTFREQQRRRLGGKYNRLEHEPEDRGSLRAHARAAGKAEIREEVLEVETAKNEEPWSCGPDCSLCGWEE